MQRIKCQRNGREIIVHRSIYNGREYVSLYVNGELMTTDATNVIRALTAGQRIASIPHPA